MLRSFAMGSPFPLGGDASGWDYWPVFGFVGSLLLVRYVVEVRLRAPVVVACLVVGSVFASVVDAWGIASGLGAAMGLALLARLVRPAPQAN